jgi:hypothetical protein
VSELSHSCARVKGGRTASLRFMRSCMRTAPKKEGARDLRCDSGLAAPLIRAHASGHAGAHTTISSEFLAREFAGGQDSRTYPDWDKKFPSTRGTRCFSSKLIVCFEAGWVRYSGLASVMRSPIAIAWRNGATRPDEHPRGSRPGAGTSARATCCARPSPRDAGGHGGRGPRRVMHHGLSICVAPWQPGGRAAPRFRADGGGRPAGS